MPVPNEGGDIVNLERMLSEAQAQQLEAGGALYDVGLAKEKGFDVETIVRKIAQVSERPNLYYRVHILGNSSPNAAALPDGRVYVTLGMLDYLKSRGSREDELAFIIAHEIGHTCAQHLVQAVQQVERQRMLAYLLGAAGVAIGAAIANPQSVSYGTDIQNMGNLGLVVAQAINNAQTQGFSQAQELEADQLALRYLSRAGYRPEAAIGLLEDFNRFEFTGPFLQTHPPSARRAEDVRQFLMDTGVYAAASPQAAALPAPPQPSSPAPIVAADIPSIIRGPIVSAQKITDSSLVINIQEESGAQKAVMLSADTKIDRDKMQLALVPGNFKAGSKVQATCHALTSPHAQWVADKLEFLIEPKVVVSPPANRSILAKMSDLFRPKTQRSGSLRKQAQLARTAPARITIYSNIEVVGNDEFIESTKAALGLLQARARDAFLLARERIYKVRSSDRDFCSLEQTPTILEIRDQTVAQSPAWLAGVIARSACEVKTAQAPRTFFAREELNQRPSGAECATLQLNVLRALDASSDEINAVKPYL